MNQFLLLFFIWMIGASFGSFFMVIGLRVPTGHLIVGEQSTCTGCFHYLSLIEMIPFFSYVVQRGHCRHCHRSFSYLYPFIETLTGLLFVLIFFRFINEPKEILSLFILVAFGIIFIVSDLYYLLLPDSLMFLFFLSTLINRLWFYPSFLSYYIISGISFFLFFYGFHFLTSQGIGGGDVKLFGILGLFFGYELTLLILFIACLSSLSIGLILLALKKVSRQTPLPFAPFIFLGSFIVALCGKDLLSSFSFFT